MTSLSEIKLTWYRNFIQQGFDLTAPVIGIAGKNGIGKTNLLDAIYYLCYTKSYFQSKERNNIHFQYSGFRIEGKWSDGAQTVCMYKDGKKSIVQDGLEYEKVSEHIGKYYAIMIAPDDLSIINEGSDKRRKFADGLLAQTDKEYLKNLLLYQKTLQQKNAYLKQTFNKRIDWKLLDVYDEQLARSGAYLIEKRKELSAFLPEKVRDFYLKLSGEENEFADIVYQPCTEPEKLLEFLHYNRQYDVEYKRTTKGVHTEDWDFSLNQNPLKNHASQGQKKSFLIALKLAQLFYLKKFNKAPLLLMDDIFEKLDKNRVERLFGLLHTFELAQIFITHTEASELEKTLTIYNKDFRIISLNP